MSRRRATRLRVDRAMRIAGSSDGNDPVVEADAGTSVDTSFGLPEYRYNPLGARMRMRQGCKGHTATRGLADACISWWR